MGRAPCCDKTKVKRGAWSPEEDDKLKSYIQLHGTGGNWITLPHKIGLKRCGKSCRLRWLNYLRPNIKHGEFTEEEDYIICSLYLSIGTRWSIIAAQLPRRTDNDIKNYWNTKLKKKLLLGTNNKTQQIIHHKTPAENSNNDNNYMNLYYQTAPFPSQNSNVINQTSSLSGTYYDPFASFAAENNHIIDELFYHGYYYDQTHEELQRYSMEFQNNFENIYDNINNVQREIIVPTNILEGPPSYII